MNILRGSDHKLQDVRFLLENNKQWEDEFFFIQAADTQLGLMQIYGANGKKGIQYPESNWEEEIRLCRLSVELMNNMQPKPSFFVVCGDLVDAMPDKFPDIRQKQVKDLKEVYSHLDKEIPMVCVCGNHDVGQSPTHQTIEDYKSDFGDDYFYFCFKGVFFIVLNSQFYVDSTNVPDLYEAHEHWLEEVLNLEERKKAKHTVIFQHVPWFLDKYDEGIDYFNIEPVLRKKMLDKFYDAGVRKIFTGHYHRNAGGMYKDLEVVVTSAIGCQIGPDQHGMRIVQVSENKIEHEYFALDDFPQRFDGLK